MKFEKPKSRPIDPLVRALTPEAIEVAVADYERLLGCAVREQEVHDFLANHSYFFNGIIRLFGVSPIYSKVRLGSDYELDFACFDSGSFGPEWNLIEIEPPTKKMFKKSDEPTADLTHAIQQVRDWNAWVHENLSYARRVMPHIEYPLGYLFIGRRSDLTSSSQRKLRRIVHDHRMFLRIHTLDWFAAAARSVVHLVRSGEGGRWPVPMRALSHADLAAGRPAMSREWLADPRVVEARARLQGTMLNQREYGHLLTEYGGEDE